jgi:hypothetical protein
VLPAFSCDEHGVIQGGLSERKILITDELLGMVRDDAVLFTGVAHPLFRRRCLAKRIKLIELF